MFILFIVRNDICECAIALIFVVCYITTLVFSVKAYNLSVDQKDEEKNQNIRIAQMSFNATILLVYFACVLNYLISIFKDWYLFKTTIFTLNTYTAAVSTIIAILELCFVQKKC